MLACVTDVCTDPGRSFVEHAFDDAHDVIDLRERKLLQIGSVRHGHLRARDALGRAVQLVKRLLDRHRDDLRPHALLRPALLDGQQAVRLLDRVRDGLAVQGLERPQVDNLACDALSLVSSPLVMGTAWAKHATRTNAPLR